jgi:hypothetical protein
MDSQGKISGQVRRAMRQGKRVEQAVRGITLRALTRAELDRPALQKVTREVVGAIHDAAAAQGATAEKATRQAIAGVDRALAHAAQALKLSIEEAADRAGRFSRGDLAKARSDLGDLQRIFLGTLRDTARAGRGAAAAILKDLVRHAEASGTAVGRQIDEAEVLSARAARAGRASFAAGAGAVAASGAMLARVAAGVLAGIADTAQQSAARRR